MKTGPGYGEDVKNGVFYVFDPATLTSDRLSPHNEHTKAPQLLC